METEIRHRLTALEDNMRQGLSLGAALLAVVSLLPETASLDKSRVKSLVKTMLQDRADAVALEIKANKFVEQILGSAIS